MSKMEDAFGKVLDKYYLMVCIAYRDCNIEKLSTLALDIIIILEQEMGYSSGALDGLLYGASDLERRQAKDWEWRRLAEALRQAAALKLQIER